MADYHILHARRFGSNMRDSLLVVINMCIFAAYSDIFRKRNIKIILSVYVINIVIIFSLIYIWNNRFHSSINIFFVLLGIIVSIIHGIKDTKGHEDNNEDSIPIKVSIIFSILYMIFAIISATYAYVKSDIYGHDWILILILFGIGIINYFIRAITIK